MITVLMNKYKIDKKRPMSWSQISCFEWNKEDWFQKYHVHAKCTAKKCVVTGKPNPKCPVVATSPELTFGKAVGERLAFDPKYLPEVPRLPIFEHRLLVEWGGMMFVGYTDALSLDHKTLYEYKTGKKSWGAERVNSHGQLTLYVFLLNLLDGTKPQDIECTLHWLPTEESLISMDGLESMISFVTPVKVHSFKTKRTEADIKNFQIRILKVLGEMKNYLKEQVC